MAYDIGAGSPSYLRRAPRWYDGIARLLDLGGTANRRMPFPSDEEALAEDLRLVQDDLRRALAAMSETPR